MSHAKFASHYFLSLANYPKKNNLNIIYMSTYIRRTITEIRSKVQVILFA